MNNCTICKSEETRELLKWNKYTINKCNNCQLIFTTPLPSDNELNKFYQSFMFKKPENDEIRKRTKKRKKELKKLFNFSDISETHLNKRFLDFGGGTGIAYNSISELGFDAYYHDPDNEAVKFTADKFGLTPEKTINDINKCNIKFDYILSDNVIEHVRSPYDFVKNLLNKLENGGTLVIKTPHASNTEIILNPVISINGYFLTALKNNSLKRAIQAYLARFWHCDPPRHLYSFSKNSLSRMMAKLQTSKIDFGISYYHTEWFDNTITRKFFLRPKRLKGLRSVFIRLIIFPVLPVEILLQIIKHLFLKLGILSPGGIILRINKHQIAANERH